jgi:hypothetical protein
MSEWQVAVGISPVDPGPGSAQNPFQARVLTGPAEGMFAFGATFKDARAGLVEVLWALADNTPGLTGVDSIEMHILTVKHFARTTA